MINLIDEAAAAQLLGLRRQTLTRWRWEGKGPPFCKIGGRAVRYRVPDIEAFIANAVVAND